MTLQERKEFRKSSKWKTFRSKMKKRYCSADVVTHERLTLTWNLHHINLDNKMYDDLSNTNMFVPLNEQTHKIIHWFYQHMKKDTNFSARFMLLINKMRMVNGLETSKCYKNKKTGHEYTVLDTDIINTTNKDDGMTMVMYTDGTNTFVRETLEFYDKFIPVN